MYVAIKIFVLTWNVFSLVCLNREHSGVGINQLKWENGAEF